MLLAVGVILLILGIIMVRTANSRYGDDAPQTSLRKVGFAVVFIGIVVLMFVLAINILVWTGRYGVIR